jgi:hypothetical protein
MPHDEFSRTATLGGLFWNTTAGMKFGDVGGRGFFNQFLRSEKQSRHAVTGKRTCLAAGACAMCSGVIAGVTQ